jgi:hypothetical protein
MAGVIDISDAFLQELRLNEEFNKILAKGELYWKDVGKQEDVVRGALTCWINPVPYPSVGSGFVNDASVTETKNGFEDLQHQDNDAYRRQLLLMVSSISSFVRSLPRCNTHRHHVRVTRAARLLPRSTPPKASDDVGEQPHHRMVEATKSTPTHPTLSDEAYLNASHPSRIVPQKTYLTANDNFVLQAIYACSVR